VVNKRDKASHILQLNGIKAEAEMIATRRAAQEKAARRVARNVIAKYGPVDVEEGEFRCAVINTELLQSREKEKKRLEKKHQKIETKAINAWTRGFRRQACHSLNQWRRSIDPVAAIDNDNDLKRWSRVPGSDRRWVCDTDSSAENFMQLLSTLVDDLRVVTTHYLLQRDLRLQFFKSAVRQEKQLQAQRLHAEMEQAQRQPFGERDFVSEEALREAWDEAVRLTADTTRLPIGWSMPWRPAIELPWEFPIEISRAVVAGWMQQKIEEKAKRCVRAKKAAETRRLRKAAAGGSAPESTQQGAGDAGDAGGAGGASNSGDSSSDGSGGSSDGESVGSDTDSDA